MSIYMPHPSAATLIKTLGEVCSFLGQWGGRGVKGAEGFRRCAVGGALRWVGGWPRRGRRRVPGGTATAVTRWSGGRCRPARGRGRQGGVELSSRLLVPPARKSVNSLYAFRPTKRYCAGRECHVLYGILYKRSVPRSGKIFLGQSSPSPSSLSTCVRRVASFVGHRCRVTATPPLHRFPSPLPP